MALISPLQKQVGVFKGGFFGEDSRIVQIDHLIETMNIVIEWEQMQNEIKELMMIIEISYKAGQNKFS